MITSLKLAKAIAELAADKKAEDIVVLDMKKVANFCDYFVVCSGTSNRHVKAIADHIDEYLEKFGSKTFHKQGTQGAHWVLLDLGDVVVHIFDPDTREFYGLEYLWQEAKKVSWRKKK